MNGPSLTVFFKLDQCFERKKGYFAMQQMVKHNTHKLINKIKIYSTWHEIRVVLYNVLYCI